MRRFIGMGVTISALLALTGCNEPAERSDAVATILTCPKPNASRRDAADELLRAGNDPPRVW